jgi:hypothetical protein
LKPEFAKGKGVGLAVDGLRTPKLAQRKNRQVDRSLGIEVSFINHELAEQEARSPQQTVSVGTDAFDNRVLSYAILIVQEFGVRRASATGGRGARLFRLPGLVPLYDLIGDGRAATHRVPRSRSRCARDHPTERTGSCRAARRENGDPITSPGNRRCGGARSESQ